MSTKPNARKIVDALLESTRETKFPITYGFWMDPMGKYIPVIPHQGHAATARELRIPEQEIPDMLRKGWIRGVINRHTKTVHFEHGRERAPTMAQLTELRRKTADMELERLFSDTTGREFGLYENLDDVVNIIKESLHLPFKAVGSWESRYPEGYSERLKKELGKS